MSSGRFPRKTTPGGNPLIYAGYSQFVAADIGGNFDLIFELRISLSDIRIPFRMQRCCYLPANASRQVLRGYDYSR